MRKEVSYELFATLENESLWCLMARSYEKNRSLCSALPQYTLFPL